MFEYAIHQLSQPIKGKLAKLSGTATQKRARLERADQNSLSKKPWICHAPVRSGS
jgi:hypothetical protein